jgi:hypothetical protein
MHSVFSLQVCSATSVVVQRRYDLSGAASEIFRVALPFWLGLIQDEDPRMQPRHCLSKRRRSGARKDRPSITTTRCSGMRLASSRGPRLGSCDSLTDALFAFQLDSDRYSFISIANHCLVDDSERAEQIYPANPRYIQPIRQTRSACEPCTTASPEHS